MSLSKPAVAQANGLNTVLNVIAAPREAFESIRTAPTWGWAFIITAVLSAIGQYLAIPATIHAVQTAWPAQIAANPQVAALTPAQQQHALDVTIAIMHWMWLVAPFAVLVVAAAETLIMLVFKAAGRGEATFKQLWCTAMNSLVVGIGVYNLLNGLIAVVRGPASYNSSADAFRAMPGLAWLASTGSVKLVAFLGAFNVVSIWGAVLLAAGMVAVAKVSKINAAFCVLTITALAGLFLSAGAR